mgnify:FL=1
MAFISSTSRGFSPAACRIRATVSKTDPTEVYPYFWQSVVSLKTLRSKNAQYGDRVRLVLASFIRWIRLPATRFRLDLAFVTVEYEKIDGFHVQQQAVACHLPFVFLVRYCDVGLELVRVNTEADEWKLGYKLPSCVASTQGRYRKIFFGQSDSMIDINRYIIQNSF